MSRLFGKTALVTNASSGTGRACAVGLAAAGAQVLIHHGQASKEAESVVEQIRNAGGRAGTVCVDLADPEGPDKLAKQARGIIGDRLDILVVDVGLANPGTSGETMTADFDGMIAADVRAPFFLVQQLIPITCKGSCIVFVSCLAAQSAVDNLSAYAPTTGAIDRIARHFASVLELRGVRVNVLALGEVEDVSGFPKTDAGRECSPGLQSLRRLTHPDDVGAAVALLASDGTRCATGDILQVDGGFRF